MLFYQGFHFTQGISSKILLSFGISAFVLTGPAWAGSGFDHSPWGKLLKAHVSEGWVDYRGLAADRDELDHYLERLSAVQKAVLESWPREDQIAFYLNAYNAITVERILDHYPPEGAVFFKKMRSIRTISGVWNEIEDRVAGQDLMLDDIENEILRKRYQEPLVHFAIVCASRSCPPLSQEPLEGPMLMTQLQQRAQEFLLDSTRGVFIDLKKNRVSLSKIFDWFGEDFIARYGGGKLSERYGGKLGAVLNFVSLYLPSDQKEFIQRGGYRVDFLSYDWSLNEAQIYGAERP